MKPIIRYGTKEDFDFLKEYDDIQDKDIKRCIQNNAYIVVEQDKSLLGFLRYSTFWHEIPYMEMIRILKHRRGKGLGTKLFKFWEHEMKNSKIIMTSSISDETAPQQFHQRNGFIKAGEINFGSFNPVPEIFFIKNTEQS